ncbi:MAG: T9SS type A sorting domain-containing protein [Saprospiraceae bacterium]|nr:T9SS type A sorting domain-containing protein [Saprospiraceae bacterium]
MKFLLKCTFLLFCSFTSSELTASMICPPDKYIRCDDDLHDLNLTGRPTLFGSHQYLTPVYEDQYYTNACNVGRVLRKWYLDLNHNYQADTYEPTCHQNIYISENNYGTIIVKFPKDIVVNCLDQIPYTGPEITSRPCDLMGVSYRDEVYNLLGSAEDGCKKILRKFTVINWCDYTPNNPFGGSVWYGTQVIKVIDKVKPVITKCEDLTFGFNNGCKSVVTLTNKATDDGACGSTHLSWIVEVDVWGDGKTDYVYSNTGVGQFYLPLIPVNDEVKVTLPVGLTYGKHKVIWRAKDACGNISSCATNFTTRDTKPPTPYCVQFVSVAIDGKDGSKLRVPASMFNLGASDNCSAQHHLRFSFSPNVADSVRYYDCTNAGFQYLTVYATDIMGNQDFCAVFMIVYDNGSCSNTLSAGGRVASPQGKMVKLGDMIMQGNKGNFNVYEKIEDGRFDFNNVAIYNDMQFIPSRTGIEAGQVDLVDYVMFKNYLMGTDTLTPLGYLAADINDDKKVNARDFILIKDFLLKNKTSFGPEDWRFFPSYIDLRKVSLSTYSPVYDTRKFNGFIDFTAIAKGDLSETLPTDDAFTRSDDPVKLSLANAITMDGKEYIPVNVEHEIVISGLKLVIDKAIEPFFIGENFESIVLENGATNILLVQNTHFKKGETMFYLPYADLKGMNMEGTVIEEGSFDKRSVKFSPLAGHNSSLAFPNPFGRQITIEAALGSYVEIYSVEGKIIHTFNMISTSQLVNTDDWKSGVYFVTVENHGNREIHKMMKF